MLEIVNIIELISQQLYCVWLPVIFAYALHYLPIRAFTKGFHNEIVFLHEPPQEVLFGAVLFCDTIH